MTYIVFFSHLSPSWCYAATERFSSTLNMPVRWHYRDNDEHSKHKCIILCQCWHFQGQFFLCHRIIDTVRPKKNFGTNKSIALTYWAVCKEVNPSYQLQCNSVEVQYRYSELPSLSDPYIKREVYPIPITWLI